jgi:hypothetical protein
VKRTITAFGIILPKARNTDTTEENPLGGTRGAAGTFRDRRTRPGGNAAKETANDTGRAELGASDREHFLNDALEQMATAGGPGFSFLPGLVQTLREPRGPVLRDRGPV